MLRSLDVGTSIAATLACLAQGAGVGALGERPEQPLVLYEFESCPFCRKVREALTVLDLDAEIRPCPKGGTRFRRELMERGGKAQFPYLIDPNSGKEMYESEEINRYLFRQYGETAVPRLISGSFAALTGSLASAWRLGRGTQARAAKPPQQPLELWSFEASPFCRLVREALCELELPYLLHNVGKGSPRRAVFVEHSGKMRVPYLADPNTGFEMFESADIVAYLEERYAA